MRARGHRPRPAGTPPRPPRGAPRPPGLGRLSLRSRGLAARRPAALAARAAPGTGAWALGRGAGPCARRGDAFFFQAEDGIRYLTVTGVQTCALPISRPIRVARRRGTVPRPGAQANARALA